MPIPRTRFARSRDGADIAYQVLGEGPIEIVVIHPWVSHLERYWEWPGFARLMSGLAGFARVVHFDKRGTGLSDRTRAAPDMEVRAEDVLAVADAAGMDRPALVGWGDGAAVAAFVAATRPERVRALALYGSNIRVQEAPDFPWGQAPSEHEGIRAASDGTWGDVDHIREQIGDAVGYVGALQDDPAFLEWLARMLRNAATPSGARAIDRTWYETDARSALPSIQAPTAFVYRTGDDPEGAFRAEQEHYAGLVPGARLIPLEGREWAAFLGDVDGLVAAIRGFVTGVHEEEIELDRVLATVVFTDLVGSTQRAAELGDRAWRAIRDRHHAAVRAMIGRYRGVEVDTAGDGFLATFDGPARGVRAATAIVEAVRSLGIEVRVGVHTGEVTRSGSGISGIAVHIGARIGALAGPSEVLVSQTVKDLVAGAGLRFTAAGEHELKGVPGEWRVYRVEPPSSP